MGVRRLDGGGVIGEKEDFKYFEKLRELEERRSLSALLKPASGCLGDSK